MAGLRPEVSDDLFCICCSPEHAPTCRIRNVGIIGHPGAAEGLDIPQDVEDIEVALWP